MPRSSRFDHGYPEAIPTVAWDDIVWNSLGGVDPQIYVEACLLSDFYFQVFNRGIEGWIGNRHFFRIHEVRKALRNIGGTAALEIESLLAQVLPFLDFSFDPLIVPPDPIYYLQRPLKDDPGWEEIKDRVNERIWTLKNEFRTEGEEYFAAHWKSFSAVG
jgi:hypothetical protein